MPQLEPAQRRSADMVIFGMPMHRVGVPELHEFIERAVRENRKSLIFNVNIHCMVLALSHPWLKGAMNEAHLVYCDGDGVRWGARLLGYAPPPKVGFTRWMWDLAAFCEKKKFRLYLLGGKPGIAAMAAEKMKQRYPDLEIAGTGHGYFKKEGPEGDQVIDAINRSVAHILVIGFGMPVQEKWIMENWEKIQTNVFLPGGAVLDYAAGALGQAPAWMVAAHLEWLFRIWEDPKRLFGRYVYDIPVFFWNILKEKFFGGKKPSGR